MKNEFMARAMSHIDDALIEEANEAPVRRAKVLTPKAVSMIVRYGSMAACAVLVVGLMIMWQMTSGGVLLYGESVSDSPRTITEYMPRAVTHLVDLTENTIKDNSRLFADINDVPRQALSMGIKNIMQAKSVLMVVSGANKADAVYGMVKGEVTPDLPASVLQLHPNVTIVCDKAAAAKL